MSTRAYRPTQDDLAAAAQCGMPDPDAPAGDYIIEHSVTSSLPPIAPRIGIPPRAAAEAISNCQELALPIVGINDHLSDRKLTLLHLAAYLYSQAARSMSTQGRARAYYYEQVCRLLLDAGADPQARMSTDISILDRAPTPAAVCEGWQPLCLRARMLREAADGHCGEIAPRTRSHIYRRTATRRITHHRVRSARGVIDTGTSWRVYAIDAAHVADIVYDRNSKSDRMLRHRDAIVARDSYEIERGFSSRRHPQKAMA